MGCEPRLIIAVPRPGRDTIPNPPAAADIRLVAKWLWVAVYWCAGSAHRMQLEELPMTELDLLLGKQ